MGFFKALSWFSLLYILFSILLLKITVTVFSRLFLHPLSKIPGPWYAAASSLYEFWWDCPKNGRYWKKIEEMHERYGPIVRINPWEVHINDPVFIDKLWSDSTMEKDPFFYGGFGVDTAAVSTVKAELHHIRRGAMAPFFSKGNVAKLEQRVIARVRQLCERIEEFRVLGKAVGISDAYRCLATDIVTDYAVPNTRTMLAHPDFAPGFVRAVRNTAALINWNRYLRFVYPLMVHIPRQLVAFFDPGGALTDMVDNQNDMYNQAKATVEKKWTKTTETVMSVVFEHRSLPSTEKTIGRLFDEIVTVIGAGTETTGNTLSTLTFHVIHNLTIARRLKAELTKAAQKHNIPPESYLPCRVVETLPYLRAVMLEALRYSTSVTGRLPRRNPSAVMTYGAPSGMAYVLPPGTTISMSIRDIHFNADIFKDPYEFNPERWYCGNGRELARMEEHMVAFGKGVRACLGRELAKQEILLVAGNLFWKYDFELYETSLWDVMFVHDYFSPFGPGESKGVRVKVKT